MTGKVFNILACFAHPDDEAYGPGATLARYALAGHRVGLVTMTRGEAGSLGICKTMTRPDIAAMRTAELQCAAGALHISDLKIYDLPDKALKEIPLPEGAAIVAREVERFKADILITFHDRGISGHPDHIAVNHWCREAVIASRRPVRLLAYGVSRKQAMAIAHLRKVIPFDDNEITHVLSAQEFFEYKRRAINCHQSQLDLWNSINSLNQGEKYFGSQEVFSQVIPAMTNGHPAEDILVG